MAQPIEYDPERHDLPPVLDVHHAALQEIDKVVGNELTLDEDDTTRLRGILHAALNRSGPGSHEREPLAEPPAVQINWGVSLEWPPCKERPCAVEWHNHLDTQP